MTLGVNQKDEPVTVSQQRSQVACRRYMVWGWSGGNGEVCERCE